MKKKGNKLYVVNKFNKPAFMQDENLFPDGGDIWTDLAIENRGYKGGTANEIAGWKSDYMNSKNAFGISKANNPFSKGNLKGGLGAMAKTSIGSAALGAAGDAVGRLIGGGLQSGAGSLISGLGDIASNIPVYGKFAGPALKVAAGVANALVGTKIDQEKLNAAKEGTSALNNFSSNATSLDDIKGIQAQANVQDAYKGGLLKKGWEKEMNAQLRDARTEATLTAQNSILNNAFNIEADALGNEERNFSAFGGPLDMGAINYDFMTDYLLSKNKKADDSNKMTNLFAGTPKTMFDFGGDLQTNFADFSTGLIHIDAGQSHELNPNDGVQIGTDQQGVPNLVEEGEVIWQDYVFSNRIPVDQTTKEKFHLPKKKDITYADLAKRLEKEISERPNDVISEAGFKAQMQQLEEQQERQKQEMEAQRAKEAFESLSPEEKEAVMQQAAQQEAAAQQVAQAQQPIPEEAAIAEQQQAVQADGTEANVGQVPVMAEGGHIFKNGSYLWDKFWSPVNEYSKQKGNSKDKYRIAKYEESEDAKKYKTIKDLEDSESYKAFTDYILNNATDEERQKYFQWIDDNTGRENKYLDKEGKLIEGWQKAYEAARNDGKYGIQHYTPEWQEALADAVESPEARIFHALEGDEDYIQGELNPEVAGDEVRRATLPNGDTVIYHARKSPATITSASETLEEVGPVIEPTRKKEWMRYMGMLGPSVGLGMMAAGVGKPDYSDLDAAVRGAGNVHLADYKPIGDYLKYTPLDIWFEQNRNDANARATDRAILNTGLNPGNQMAGLLANSYNSQIANGELFRKANESNIAQRHQVADFNRGTNMFNSEAYNRLSQFNASALNDAEGRNTNARLHAAQEKLNRDAGWYNSLYGNVSGIFKGISDLGRENRETNWRNALVTSGAFGVIDPDKLVKAGIAKYSAADGGKVKRKKGKRGLTI